MDPLPVSSQCRQMPSIACSTLNITEYTFIGVSRSIQLAHRNLQVLNTQYQQCHIVDFIITGRASRLVHYPCYKKYRNEGVTHSGNYIASGASFATPLRYLRPSIAMASSKNNANFSHLSGRRWQLYQRDVSQLQYLCSNSVRTDCCSWPG